MNLLIIPDAHAAPGYDNERFTAVGQYLMRERPEHVVCLGDWADLPSLSSYDRGTKGLARAHMTGKQRGWRVLI